MTTALEEFIAGVPETADVKDIGPAPYSTLQPVKQSFARTETLKRGGGLLKGCWSDTFSGACTEQTETSIEISAIIDEQGFGNCSSTGKSVRAVTHG